MRVFYLLFKKEIKSYFLSPLGWLVLGMVLFMQGLSMTTAMEKMKDAPLAVNFINLTFQSPNFWFYFLFIFPLITMRLFAEEEKSGTLEILMTAPVRTYQVVLTKYLSALVFYGLLWTPLLLHLKIFSSVTGSSLPYETGHLIGTYVVLILIGSFYIAIGCFASSLSSSQIIAGILTLAFLVILFFLGFFPYYVGGIHGLSDFFHYIAVQEHLNTFCRGLMDTRALVFYLSMSIFFLFLTCITVDFRRWKK